VVSPSIALAVIGRQSVIAFSPRRTCRPLATIAVARVEDGFKCFCESAGYRQDPTTTPEAA
jgi:hypothetical protein